MSRALALLAAVAALAVSASSASAQVNGVNAIAASQTAPSIIMRDGGVCDPIRHMGC
jgi:hypothetical protein